MATVPIPHPGRHSRGYLGTVDRRDRLIASTSAFFVHALLVALLLHAGIKGIGGARGRSDGRGDSLVVYPSMLTSHEQQSRASAALATQPPSVAIAQQKTQPATEHTNSTNPTPPKAVIASNTRTSTASNIPAQTTSKAAQAASSQSAPVSNGGSSGNDLLASYQAALRSAIYGKWQNLTKHGYPSGCVIHLSQNPGGTVTATSAATCGLSKEDQQQLEAAALMAQPMPYAGYEPVFTREMDLVL